MSESQDEQFKKAIQGLDELEEVPEATAYRYRSKLNELASADRAARQKWTSSVPWKLVAGLVLVLSLGISFQVIPTQDAQISLPPNSESTITPGTENVNPTPTETPKELPSQPGDSAELDYSSFKDLENISIPEDSSFLTTQDFPEVFKKCSYLLDKEPSLTFVEPGNYKGEKIMAVWSMRAGNSWQITIIDRDCETRARYKRNG
jgi:hypothetical protein